MKFLKKLFVFVFILSLVLSVVGCRTKEAPIGADKTERTITIYGLEDAKSVFDPLLQQYTIKHPNTTINYVKFGNFEDYEKWILNAMAEGAGPDIFMMPNDWFIRNRRKLVAMPETQGTVAGVRNIFVNVVAKDMITTDDSGIERVYGLPLYVDTLAIYYNKDQFEDKIPTRGRPSTLWDGIKNDVFILSKMDQADLSRFDVAGIGMGLSSNVTYAPDILASLMLQYGTKFYNETMSQSTILAADEKGNTPSVSAMDLYTSFADPSQKHYSFNKYVGEGLKYPDIDAFVMGKVSMIFGYSTTYNLILAERNDLKAKGADVIDVSSIKTAPFPQIVNPIDSTTEQRKVYANYYALGVSRNSKNQEAAWDIITTLTSPDSEKLYFSSTNKPTSRRDLITTQALDPIFGTFVNQVGFADSFPVADYLKFKGFFRGAIAQVESGGQSLAAIRNLQSSIQAMLPAEGFVVPLNKEYYKNQAK